MDYMLGTLFWKAGERTAGSLEKNYSDGQIDFSSAREAKFTYDGKPFHFDEKHGLLCGILGYFNNLDEVGKRNRINKVLDTEVVAELYRSRGLRSLEELDGHFVIFIYDRDKARAFVVQPEQGSFLPVYYSLKEDGVVFSTSLKLLLQESGINRSLDIGSAKKFLFRRYIIPDESTLIEGVKKLVPQRYLSIDLKGGNVEAPMSIARGLDIPSGTAEENWIGYIEKSVNSINSDVLDETPAVALSGGYDSNLLLHLLRGATGEPIVAATVDGGEGHNEVPRVKKIIENYDGVGLVTSSMSDEIIDSFPDIVWRYEGYLFEGGVFLRYAMCLLLQESGKKTAILGSGANEIITLERNSVFFSKIDSAKSAFINLLKRTLPGLIYYRLLAKRRDPYDMLTRQFIGSAKRVKYNSTFDMLLKMHDLLLNSFGIQGIHPFINRETMSAALALRKRNLHKALHNRIVSEFLGREISDKIEMSDIVSNTARLFQSRKNILMKVLESDLTKALLKSKQIDDLRKDPESYHLFILQLNSIYLFDRLIVSGEFDGEFGASGIDVKLDELLKSG